MADSIEITEVVVHATAGANVGVALREAIALAANEWRNVRLIHNNKEYTVKVNDLLACCEST